MARGWESKSIEEQQAAAGASVNPRGKQLSPEQQVRLRQVEGLQLARKQVERQLAAATNPVHRNMLQEALAELDRQLHELSEP